MNVSLFSSNAVMVKADDAADLVEEFRHRLILKETGFEKLGNEILG